MSSPNLTSRWSYKKQFLLRFRSDRLLREMMSWHLRSVTFAADLSVNDLTWEAFLTKVYAPSTEQPLVSKNCEFLIESNVLVNQKLKPRPEVFFQFCHLANVVECFDRRSSPSTRLDFACVERSTVCNDYAISRVLHFNKNISPWMAVTKISDKIGEINKNFKGSSTLGRHQEISS